jgi:hypothetical protein
VKRDESTGEGASNHPGKKKNKRNNGGFLVATTDRKGGKAAFGETPDHFKKMLEKPCLNHAFPVKHLYKDCALMKKYLSGGSRKGEQKKKPESTEGDAEGKDDGFPDTDGCLMVFGGPTAYESRHCQKLTHREVYMAEPATPLLLRWSESAITFDRSDHPSSVPQPGRCPLVVDLIVSTKLLTKVLMDGGSSLNIMYVETLDAMGIDWSRIRPSGAPFHDIVMGKQAILLGQIDLPVTFRVLGSNPSPSRWSDFMDPATPSWGGRAMRSSWPSPTTHTSSSRC